MGQSTSAAGKIILNGRRTKLLSSKSPIETDESEVSPDYTSYIPDECLALVFQFLNSGNRKRCALVCRRWMIVEGRNRHRLSLHARSGLITSIPSLFSRFDSVVKLSLKCDRRSVSINDEALAMISLRCRNLKRLKLRACRELTYKGMATFAENCKGLNILSCGSCDFGAEGVKAVLDHCSSLEELSIKRLRNFTDSSHEPIGPGLAASSLKSICLKELYIGECFGPVIAGAKNLRSLKLFRCSGDWDMVLEEMAVKEHGIVEIHLERMQVTDVALAAISNCSSLESLHLVKTPECTNGGLAGIAEKCKCLRKLHIDGWKANLIGDEGLVAVAKFCSKLQELNLERLALCGCDTFGDPELSCIAAKCPSLRKLCIKNCPISDLGIENLANGCPDTVEPEGHEEGSNDAVEGGLQENRIEFPSLNSQIVAPSLASSSRSRSGLLLLMDLETENRIASVLLREAAELRRQAEKDGVRAYIEKPNVRHRPNSRFLTATVLEFQQ
ncbi:hypothetical protein HID58_018457 [Brassica napus]|uniref:F-box domain-containing protein n=1 Tax=Brassica napus TaxID=3708 RepID=A0ABQ8DA10_BRANA|nr:hypothetical protein HID58_018457 [Brassica napus]